MRVVFMVNFSKVDKYTRKQVDKEQP